MFTAEVVLADTICNGDCKYCYAGYNQERKPSGTFKPDFNKFKKTLRDFYEVDRKVTGNEAKIEIWGGEPSINPWLVPTCKAINEVFEEFEIIPRITMVTNGYSLKNAFETTPDNLVFQISNDMAFQTLNRGRQPMEEESWSKLIKDIYDKGRLSGFQMVIDPDSSDVMKSYQYFLDWETRYDIDTTLGFMVCKSYGTEGTEHLFNKENCGLLQSSLIEVYKTILDHIGKGINLKVDERLLVNLYMATLPQLLDSSGYGGRVHYPCQVFSRKACFAIDGSRYSCAHDYEEGMTPEESLKRYEHLFSRCADCTFRWICKGICAGTSVEKKKINCENLWIFYSSLRRAVLAYLPIEEMEKLEDAEIIQSYKRPRT